MGDLVGTTTPREELFYSNCHAHKSIKKWGKKGRKLRNKDPYGCHSDPDTVLQASTSSGAIVKAQHGTYAGAKTATGRKSRR